MKGDIFPLTYNVSGDIINNAIGDINQTCQNNSPYNDAQMQNLRNALSVSKSNLAIAQVEKDKALMDYTECKKKVFCNVKPKRERLNEKDLLLEAATKALALANSDLAKAEQTNKEALQAYNTCIQQQTEILKLTPAPVQDTTVPAENVSATMESPTIKYGLIGVGVVAVLAITYFMIKKK